MKKKIYKIYTERKISGVCAGLSEYFNIDVTIMRIIWVILGLCTGYIIIIYIILAIIMPDKNSLNDYHHDKYLNKNNLL